MSGHPAEYIPPVRLDNSEAWDMLLPRLKDLVLSGRFVLGPESEEFERAAALAFGTAWALGTASGTSAIKLALRAAPLEPGARVALPANTFYAGFEAVLQAGHRVVIVDHDEDYLLSVDSLDGVDVDGVVAVHLYGLPVDMTSMMQAADSRSWWVLEDCSQGHGATVGGRPIGSLGHAGAFSAYPTKNLGAWGDAGFVVGSDPAMSSEIRALRHHAQPESNVHRDVGGTDRLDNLQALVLTEKLRRLGAEVERRRRIAEWYRAALADLDLPLPGDRGNRTHAYHQFVVRVPNRDQVRDRMAARGVGTGVHYPTPIHLQPGARDRIDLPRVPERAEEWAPQLLSLPMYPGLTEGQLERVASALRAALLRA